MAEPLRADIQERLRETQTRALAIRKVDLPVVAAPLAGVLRIRPRPDPAQEAITAPSGRLRKPKPRSPEDPRIHRIQAICAHLWGVSMEELLGRRQQRIGVEARHAAVALVHALLPEVSIASIGRHFGNRDHTTILLVLRLIDKKKARPEFAARYREAEARIRAALDGN